MNFHAACLLATLVLAPTVFAEPGTITTIAGTGQPTNNGNSGSALSTNIGNPFGVEVGPDGALYITEVNHHRVWRLDLKSGQLAAIAGTGRKGYSGDGGLATHAELNEPYEIRFDKQGNIFFVEMQNHLIRRIDAKSGIISTVAGTGLAGDAGDGGPALKAQFRQPHSIALDDKGHLFVADIGNHRIRRIDLQSGRIESFAGNGQKMLPKDGQSTKGTAVLGPRALFNREGTLWVALREGNSVWRIGLDDGIWRHVAGSGAKGYSGDMGPPKLATFNGPKGIALDGAGNVYVVDTENQVIRKIDSGLRSIATIAGVGPMGRGYKGDGASALGAHLNRPHGICVGPDGAVYIGDSENHRVRQVR